MPSSALPVSLYKEFTSAEHEAFYSACWEAVDDLKACSGWAGRYSGIHALLAQKKAIDALDPCESQTLVELLVQHESSGLMHLALGSMPFVQLFALTKFMLINSLQLWLGTAELSLRKLVISPVPTSHKGEGRRHLMAVLRARLISDLGLNAQKYYWATCWINSAEDFIAYLHYQSCLRATPLLLILLEFLEAVFIEYGSPKSTAKLPSIEFFLNNLMLRFLAVDAVFAAYDPKKIILCIFYLACKRWPRNQTTLLQRINFGCSVNTLREMRSAHIKMLTRAFWGGAWKKNQRIKQEFISWLCSS
ncbi:hypothetical protein PAPHI01_1440 [Pancytospora philotis]|nr:hypothetical protein PAPHI01_1440 [Pancytospora philotis]